MMETYFSTNSMLIAGLTFLAVVSVGGAVLAVGSAQRETIEARLKAQPVGRSTKKKEQGWLVSLFSRLGTILSPKGMSDDLQKKMARAGLHGQHAASAYLGAKTILFILSFVGVAALSTMIEGDIQTKIFAVLGASATMFFIPNFVVSARISKRSGEIRMHLPDAIDLLEICVSGGMGLDMAWNAVANEVRQVSPMLADEMALTNLEKHLGADRGTAMRHMADRTGAEDLNSLVAVLVQSERFGTSVADALRVFTGSMRELRSQRAEESAEQMSVKMIFPMVTMVFPVVLIIAVGPAGITLTQVLGN